MHQHLFTDIKYLYGCRPDTTLLTGNMLARLPCIENAFLLIEGHTIADFGKMTDLPVSLKNAKRVTDATGKIVLPAWCDSHTHLVFSGSRENEFVDKIKGMTYAEIAAKGGGILHSAEKLNATSEDSLFNDAWKRLEEISKLGTGAVEIKSGYGLTIEGELKMLRVIKRLKEKSSLTIKSTFLGAHTYPTAYKNNHQGYLDELINDLLPIIAAEGLADFIDVFCDNGFFSPPEMEAICTAGKLYGLRPKLHVNQLNSIGGIESAIACNALSVDHLETMTANDIAAIRTASNSLWSGCCTALPAAAFFLRMNYPPVRELINAGAAVALASDFNPGSAPTGNMNLVIALACIQMKMLPEEAINAATMNGAFAMQVEREAGSITVGKKANVIITKPVPSLNYLPYAFGSNLIEQVMIAGDFVLPQRT